MKSWKTVFGMFSLFVQIIFPFSWTRLSPPDISFMCKSGVAGYASVACSGGIPAPFGYAKLFVTSHECPATRADPRPCRSPLTAFQLRRFRVEPAFGQMLNQGRYRIVHRPNIQTLRILVCQLSSALIRTPNSLIVLRKRHTTRLQNDPFN